MDAKADSIPVSPKKVIYLSSILLGILIPSGIIYADDLLDTKKLGSRLTLTVKL
jgi:capsular polysaccharide biosynthesis protein